MKRDRTNARKQLLLALAVVALASGPAQAESFEWKDPGPTGDRLAEYRLWLPDGLTAVRSVIALVPGYGGDGRGMADDPEWRALAQRTNSALLGCRLNGVQGGYYWEQSWAVRSLTASLSAYAPLTGHAELNQAPISLWGMSAGGCFNYLFATIFPQRTVAYVVNKSGGNMQKRLPEAARKIPALFFIGARDTPQRHEDLTMAFTIERREGALWGLVVEPEAGHEFAGSKPMGIQFLESAISLRVDETGKLKDLPEKSGWLGNLESHAIEPSETTSWPKGPMTSWFPSKEVAESWQKIVAPPNSP